MTQEYKNSNVSILLIILLSSMCIMNYLNKNNLLNNNSNFNIISNNKKNLMTNNYKKLIYR